MGPEWFALGAAVRPADRQALSINVDGATYAVASGDGPVSVGSQFPAQVVVDDARVARTHRVVAVGEEGWICTDESRTGTFVGGVARSRFAIADGLVARLGHPHGVAVAFTFTDNSDREAVDDSAGPSRGREQQEDPRLLRVGKAIAARRRALGLAQRTLARDKVINAGTLIDVEKGRRWPRESTRARLEELLQWAPGAIEMLREGQLPGDSEELEQSSVPGASASMQAECVSQAVELAVSTLKHTVADLPAPTARGFATHAAAVLSDLRRLEAVTSNATRGAPSLMRVLSEVRQTYRDLMLHAARSPHATLGQTLYAARRRAELTAEEAASAAGVDPEVIIAAEGDDALTDEDRQAMEKLVHELQGR